MNSVKKVTAIILSTAMVFTLAKPVMAAEQASEKEEVVYIKNDTRWTGKEHKCS